MARSDAGLGEGFVGRVMAAVREVPAGHVTSYGAIARRIGAPGAARQVGFAMARAGDDVPWHRVVRADGAIAGPPGACTPRMAEQRVRLEAEGVPFDARGRARFEPAPARSRDGVP